MEGEKALGRFSVAEERDTHGHKLGQTEGTC